MATWQPCFLVLSGLYLYVLESEKSPTYQRYSRFLPILLGLFRIFILIYIYVFIFSAFLTIYFHFGCCSMAGRQVFDVPPTNIGGLPFCIAISYRGLEIQKASPVVLK